MLAYSSTLKDNRMTQIVALIDAGAGPGTLEIGTTGMASVLATLTLADPCGTVSDGVLIFDFDPDISDTSADNTGAAAEARIKDSAGNVIVSGLTVGTSGSHINLSSVAITAGDTVALTTGTITHG